MHRRVSACFVAGLAVASFTVAGPARPSSAAGPSLDAVSLALAPVVTGLPSPIAMAWRSGDDRIYVAERAGKVVIVDPTTHAVVGTVLTLSGITTVGERGLLGLTFSNDGTKLYVDHTDSSGTIHIVEYTMAGDVATVASARTLLTIPHPLSNHNGGQVFIGPDDDLYIAVGDGGGGGDPDANGQNVNVLLGKILRIDPTPSATLPYTIPSDNPFVGLANHRAEIWMYGLRNPWRFSFDSANGDLWIGDVGQDKYEEVDVAHLGVGGQNWGWGQREGFHAYNGGAQPANGQNPLLEQPHGDGWCALIGGFVYRGSAIANLNGAYVYGDLCRGTLSAAVQSGGTLTQQRDFTAALSQMTAFGQDHSGEMYVAGLGGEIDELVPGAPPTISVGSKSVLEGDSGSRTLTIPITLSQPAATDVTVHYDVTGVTATGGTKRGGDVDFRLRSGTITFGVTRTGKTPISKTVGVTVFSDTAGEPDETVQVTLSSPSGGYSLGHTSALSTILNDDGVAAGPTLGVGDSSIVQQAGGAESVGTPVTLSAVAPGTSVSYTITPGSATYSSNKTAGGEFGGKLTGTLTFNSRAVTRNISVPVWPDATPDADHTFTITLSGASAGVTLIRSTGTVALLTS